MSASLIELRRINVFMWFPIKDEINRGDWIRAHQELQENIRINAAYKEEQELEKGDPADVWKNPAKGSILVRAKSMKLSIVLP